MTTDQQVRRVFRLMQTEKTFAAAASKAGMDEKTARKYVRLGKLPSQLKKERTWRTRSDPFKEVWSEIQDMLEINPGLLGTTLFDFLQREYPGRFQDGQLRTLQKHIKTWRALEGPPKEVYFPQQHHPGRLCQSDFTSMSDLKITIQGQPFRHLIYHFVLTWSNWETGMICFSESFESLSEGLQNALWELGAIPFAHQSDRMSSAVNNQCDRKEFTERYKSLLKHYQMEGRKIQTGCANENGDVEQRHYRFKVAMDQALLLRGSREFESVEKYNRFLHELFIQLNAGRQEKLREELRVMRRLPAKRIDDFKRLEVRVRSSSTIRIYNNVYSVDSRLIGEKVRIYLYADHVEVYYAQRCVARMPRLRGEGKSIIHYRHIIDWLVRKPGAFENYRYRDSLFPTHRFRVAYDSLARSSPHRASREYLQILYMAARVNESRVDNALRFLIEEEQPICAEEVEKILDSGETPRNVKEIEIQEVDLSAYDALIEELEVCQ